MYVYLCIRSFNLNFRYMVMHTYVSIQTCSPASVGFAQAHPNHYIPSVYNWQLEFDEGTTTIQHQVSSLL